MKRLLACTLLIGIAFYALAQTRTRPATDVKLPNGYWPIEKSGPLVEKTQTVRLEAQLKVRAHFIRQRAPGQGPVALSGNSFSSVSSL